MKLNKVMLSSTTILFLTLIVLSSEILLLRTLCIPKVIYSQTIRVEKINAVYLGEYLRGNDTIKIKGRLVAFSINGTEPIPNAIVFIYLNITNNESVLLSSNKTSTDGVFVFSIFVSNDFPIGWVYFTVYYPGNLLEGYAPTRFYYKAYIKEGAGVSGFLSNEAVAMVTVLTLMLLAGIVISVRRLTKGRQMIISHARWREVLDSILAHIRRKDFNFILLVSELVDELLRKYNVVPPLSASLQEKLLMIRGYLSEEAFNILKNMISLYEFYLFGGPYAKTVLINTLDFNLWEKLVNRLKQSF